MKDTQPIKRHAAIVELSRDHHFTLLLIWKIRNGLKKSIEAERISAYALHYYDVELKSHFKAEEDLLYCKMPADNPLRKQVEAEHAHIHRIAADIKANPSDTELLKQFADDIDKHVRFEERQLFNYLQETVAESELAKIAPLLNARKHEDENAWKDAFWK
ncbi:MAG: hemerythrin domain-containing protein [Bacteroidetes bacterium]|nr:hemerythrin domain-containing protein [Bacteroidota bacterium]MBS1539321.1 hemerythrin domain-containing protein [Bacteroidota bacterium]